MLLGTRHLMLKDGQVLTNAHNIFRHVCIVSSFQLGGILLLQLLLNSALLFSFALDFASCLILNHLRHGLMNFDVAIGGSLVALVETLEASLVGKKTGFVVSRCDGRRYGFGSYDLVMLVFSGQVTIDEPSRANFGWNLNILIREFGLRVAHRCTLDTRSTNRAGHAHISFDWRHH